MQFRVKYKINHPTLDDPIEGVETEASWYLIDQRGNFYSHSPMKPIESCDMRMYEELTPLILINGEYLTIKEIEERIMKCDHNFVYINNSGFIGHRCNKCGKEIKE